MEQPEISAALSSRAATASSRATAPAASASADRDYWLNTSECLFVVDVLSDDDFVFGDSNPATERATGVPAAASRGRRAGEILPAESAEAILGRYRQCVRERRPITYVETLSFPTGPSNWNTTLSPVMDAEGRVARLVGSSHQIATTNERDLLAEVELRAVLGGLPNGIALVDERGYIIFVNGVWRRFGERQNLEPHPLGIKYLDLCDDPELAVGLPLRGEVEAKLKALLAGRSERFEHRYAWRDRHYLLRASRITAGGAPRAALAHADVTDVVAAQELLARAAEQLLQVQEEERARIARELHDSTSQHLVAMGLGLAALRKSDNPGRVMDDIRRSLSEAHKEIRSLTYVLYPPNLSTQGLEATLRSFTDGYRRRTGLSVVTTVFGAVDDLPLGVQRTIFRVVQESLANIHRHAHAKRAAIDLSLKRRGLRLTVADDGRRRGEGDLVLASGVGIRGMQARFAQYSGELTVTYRPFGTVVDGFIPAGGIRRAAQLSD